MPTKTNTNGPIIKRPRAKPHPLLDRRLAANVLLTLSEKRLTREQMSAFLSMDESALTKAFQNPHRLRARIDRVSEFLGVAPGRLLEPTEAEGRAPGVDELHIQPESLVARCFPGLDDGGFLKAPPGMAIVHLMAGPENRLATPSLMLLLAPSSVEPRQGDPVFAQTSDGKRWLRLFGRDHRDNSVIILSPSSPGDAPLTSRESDLMELRAVVGPIRLGGRS